LLPLRLENPTIEEAVFEVRFQPASSSTVSLLPGLLFSKLGNDYSESESLPLASLPLAFRQSRPELKYQQQIRLSGGQASVFIGDCAAGVSVLAPYPGWTKFRPRIDGLLDVLQNSQLVKKPERISLKFVNLLTDTPSRRLDALDLSIRIAGQVPPEQGFQLRAELNQKPYVRIVEVAPDARIGELEKGATTKRGLLLSIDCIHELPDLDLWANKDQLIESLHADLRSLFFTLITKETVDRLGPLYQADATQG
jgi:uncharacterized protein (TIGR04255 family)